MTLSFGSFGMSSPKGSAGLFGCPTTIVNTLETRPITKTSAKPVKAATGIREKSEYFRF